VCALFFFFQAEDGIRDWSVTGVQTCALPIWALTAALAEPGRVRVRAAGGLGLIGPPARSSVGGLARLARDPDIPTATAACEALRSEERRVGKGGGSRGGAGGEKDTARDVCET